MSPLNRTCPTAHGEQASEFLRRTGLEEVIARHGVVNICVPAAGITRDSLAVKIDKETGRPVAN